MEYKKNIGQKIIYLLKTWDIAKNRDDLLWE